MVTYYAAQLGIALSVVDSKADYKAKIDAMNSSHDKKHLPETASIDLCDKVTIKSKPSISMSSSINHYKWEFYVEKYYI